LEFPARSTKKKKKFLVMQSVYTLPNPLISSFSNLSVGHSLKHLVPPIAVEGVITIRCDDVFDTLEPPTLAIPHFDETMGVERFMEIIRNHYAPTLDYSVFQRVADMCLDEISDGNDTFLYTNTSAHRNFLHLLPPTAIATRSYYTNVLVLMKTVIQSMVAHYKELENDGIGIWNLYAATMYSPSNPPPSGYRDYFDFLAWRFLPLFEAALMVARYQLLCLQEKGRFQMYLGELSVLGIINRLFKEIQIPDRWVASLVVEHTLSDWFNPKDVEGNEISCTPYRGLVLAVEKLRNRNALLTMKMLMYYLKGRHSYGSHLYKLSSDLIAYVGSFLIGVGCEAELAGYLSDSG
jgi:hypothetical protein